MSNENKSIIEFDFNLICEYFSAIDRQGPGSKEATIKALSFVDNLNDKSRIADLGCGTGGQTLVLAQNAPGTVTGIDLFPKFIDLFNENAKKHSLEDRVTGVVGSMDDLPFTEGELDLIWSEGAIYNIGFKKGLSYWKQFIKTGGYLAVTEACWFTPQRPAEINDFWMEAYPEIDTIPAKIAQIQGAGYVPVASFILPETCWTDNFYVPQKDSQKGFLERYPDNNTARELVANERREAELYSKYKEFYGYVFFVAKTLPRG
ncbi:MAG: class I SAM-dependent methyltransferase [Bacteroidales bacterium]|nr:class I SAM-dependent methyltransferase [Bacteroidales bacterium]